MSFGECLKTYTREISDFRRGVVKGFALLVCYKLLVYNYFPEFRDSILVSLSGLKLSKKFECWRPSVLSV